jgi:uncharacterized lipoprotein YajG
LTLPILLNIFIIYYVIKTLTKKQTNMKKIVALLAIVALASCGSGATTEVKNDSTAVAVDSTKKDSTVVTVDSTKAETKAAEVK